MPKRSDYISWDEYFMGVAILQLSVPKIRIPSRRLYR